MSSSYVLSCAVVLYVLVIPIQASEPPIVLACEFNTISHNTDTSHLISKAVAGAKQIFSCFYWSSIVPWQLGSTISYMQKRGTEIAKITPGITNTIKKLFMELEEQQYGKFTDTAINYFNEMGINPVPDLRAVGLLKKIKSFDIPLIGMGNQDSAEHEIYSRKMHQEHSIHLPTLFDGIVTIPTLEEHELFKEEREDCFVQHTENNHWLIARNASPSTHYTQTLKTLAHDLAGEAPLWTVNSKEQLAVVVNALERVYEQRTSSPESTKMFDAMMEQSRVISPTKV